MTPIVGDAETVGARVGMSMVGAAACGVGAPVNKNTVPSTMLTAMSPFKSIEAYQRQSRESVFVFARRGIR